MRRLLFSTIGLLSVVLMVGCAPASKSLTDNPDSSIKNDPSLRLVAIDLISVLGQLPNFDPWSMTVQVSPTRTSYGKAIVDALSDAGYGVQRVSADQGRNHVEYKETSIIENTGLSNAFEIEVRGVRIARNYERSKDRWVPSSPIRVFGAEPTRLVVFNELHGDEQETTQFSSGVVFHSGNGDVLESRETRVGVTRIDANSSDDTSADLAKRALLLSQASTFTRQRASADEDSKKYQSIAEVVLRFPSADPNTLGENNKQAIAKLLKNSNADTDRFVIQGCAHGKTLVWDGTESISLERQQRVNKELIVSGVEPGAIHELGCFNDSPSTEIPRQSVSLVLERLADSL